jgi:hypothetical protein
MGVRVGVGRGVSVGSGVFVGGGGGGASSSFSSTGSDTCSVGDPPHADNIIPSSKIATIHKNRFFIYSSTVIYLDYTVSFWIDWLRID